MTRTGDKRVNRRGRQVFEQHSVPAEGSRSRRIHMQREKPYQRHFCDRVQVRSEVSQRRNRCAELCEVSLMRNLHNGEGLAA